MTSAARRHRSHEAPRRHHPLQVSAAGGMGDAEQPQHAGHEDGQHVALLAVYLGRRRQGGGGRWQVRVCATPWQTARCEV